MTVSIAVATNVALSLIRDAAQISTIVQGATAAGQTVLSQEQWSAIRRLDDQARADLVAAIGDHLAPLPVLEQAAGAAESGAAPGAPEHVQDPSGSEPSPSP